MNKKKIWQDRPDKRKNPVITTRAGGPRPNSGRKPGSPNKIRTPYSVRTWKWLNRIITKAGGEDRIVELASKDDAFFMRLTERRDYMAQKADMEQAKARKEKPIELPDADSYVFEQPALPDDEEVNIEEYTTVISSRSHDTKFEQMEKDASEDPDNAES
jgi:acetolactate synthase regulatory subunit